MYDCATLAANITSFTLIGTQYGGAHEHKGPADFADKHGGGDDDDDEEGGDDIGGDERGTPQPDHTMMHPHMANHPGFQHVRHGTPAGSPPMHNGGMPQFTRGPSPLPPGMSRPSSRNAQHPSQQQQPHIRRPSSNLVPGPHQQYAPGQPPPPPSYAYQPNPPYYNPAAQMQRPPPQGVPQQAAFPPAYPPQPPSHPQMQQAVMQDNRRSSMPPAYPPQPPPQANMQRHPSADHLQPPGQRAHPSPQPQQQQRPTPSPQPAQHEFQSPQMPQPKPLPAHAKSHSIFTPIDDSRSLLAQHWGSTGQVEMPRSDPSIKIEGGGPRSASIDVAAMQRDHQARANGLSPRPPPARPPAKSPQPPQRTASSPNIVAPGKSNTNQSDAKRPRLKVQIPSEQSGDEAGTADSGQDQDTGTSQTGNGGGNSQQMHPSHGVVLPPPSPSAGALLSAGAQGPPNPFARPAPPMSTNPHAVNRDAANNHIETPISALPSRFMNDNLLPSPSSFYPEWGFGRTGDSNMLPSPLNFQTPVVSNGSGWRTEEDRKRANEDADGGDPKRTKT